MSALNIATQLLQLSECPENQTHIARDAGCLRGLLTFLTHPDEEVSLVSLRALSALSRHPANQILLLEHPGLVPRLSAIASAGDEQSATACAVLECLGVDTRKAAGDGSAAGGGVSDGAFVQSVVTMGLARNGVPVDDAGDSQARAAILKVRGVISVTGSGGGPGEVVVTFRSTVVSSADIVDAVAKGSGVAATVLSEEAAPNRGGHSSDDEEEPEGANGEGNGPSADANAENDPSVAQQPVDVEDAMRMKQQKQGKAARRGQQQHRGGKRPTRHITINAEDCSLEARLAAERRRLEQRESKVSSFFSRFGLW